MVSKSRLARLARTRRRGITPRRAATQDRLLASAASLIAEGGVGATTVEKICLDAGFSRGAFYSNFKDKNELVVELMHRHGEELLVQIRTARNHLPQVLRQLQLEGKTPSDVHLTDTAPLTNVNTPQARRELAAVADHWLRSFPLEVQDYLLREEFTLHAVRDVKFRPHLRSFLVQLQQEVANFLGDALQQVGRHPILPLTEVASMMIDLVERSFEQPLLGGQVNVESTNLSEKLLIPVLEALTEVHIEGESGNNTRFSVAVPTWARNTPED